MEAIATRPKPEEIKEAFRHLFSLSLAKVKDAAISGRLFSPSDEFVGVPGRSIAWKLFLSGEPLQPSIESSLPAFLDSSRAWRRQYADLLLELLRAPDGSYEDRLTIPGETSPSKRPQQNGNLDQNNPLSLHHQNPWKEWFASMDLRKTIMQDVERTFPDIDYFRDGEVQYQLTNILFVHSVLHPDIGYRQGMHELLAPLYYAVDCDSVEEGDIDDPSVAEACSRRWVAADAWALFTSLMKGVGRWYEWREPPSTLQPSPLPSHVNLDASGGQVALKSYVAPIVETCSNIQSNFLKSVDPELWRSLHSAGIEPQIYGIRWLRLLFTREFPLPDAMVLWDGLFASDPSLDLAQWICVAMLIRIRNKLIPSAYTEQLTYLLRYPPPPPRPDFDGPRHAILLIRQAFALQMYPTPATGSSVMMENRNSLNISVDVPEPPLRQTQRQVRPGDRQRPAGDSSYGPIPSGSKPGHSRQISNNQFALPEMIARGIMDRGEALGINKTLMTAVTELKKNLPELAASFVRTPLSPSATYTDFPLVDERPPEERPPWEPRTRFEMEKEVSEVRSLQRKLGGSVTWIVDTLLQDEDAKDEEAAKAVRGRKREALECLAYVRDVLNGAVSEVEDERLVGEDEYKRRRAQAQQSYNTATVRPSTTSTDGSNIAQQQLPSVTLPQPAVPPTSFNESRVRTHHARSSRDYFTAPSPSPPKPSPARSPSPNVNRSPATTPTPNANSAPIAPWNYTPSNFSGTPSNLATLPRPPPRTSSSILSKRPSESALSYSPTPPASDSQEPPPTNVARRTVYQDPLGALR
ncbi:hypothetical protein JAAARDRAFT_205600 [Jaapia argillacea MUCL 33604]|uniref:Rab-GAP TBC domain-containing protein n=1 Tax=Jaapia argillacea MUCL 33604 TaxID=933084 RepID=A0A067QAF2_9AGAM|nr:hypothetical protein JAAARDRAFT_205600 [Jaapia argillacea MUCL 33604]